LADDQTASHGVGCCRRNQPKSNTHTHTLSARIWWISVQYRNRRKGKKGEPYANELTTERLFPPFDSTLTHTRALTHTHNTDTHGNLRSVLGIQHTFRFRFSNCRQLFFLGFVSSFWQRRHSARNSFLVHSNQLMSLGRRLCVCVDAQFNSKNFDVKQLKADHQDGQEEAGEKERNVQQIAVSWPWPWHRPSNLPKKNNWRSRNQGENSTNHRHRALAMVLPPRRTGQDWRSRRPHSTTHTHTHTRCVCVGLSTRSSYCAYQKPAPPSNRPLPTCATSFYWPPNM
jgi:hypothetical protein